MESSSCLLSNRSAVRVRLRSYFLGEYVKKFFLLAFILFSCTMSVEYPKKYSHVVFHNLVPSSITEIRIEEFECYDTIPINGTSKEYDVEIGIKRTELYFKDYNLRTSYTAFNFEEHKTYDITFSGECYMGDVHNMEMRVEERK